MPPASPPGSSHSSTKQRADAMKKRKKSWSLEGKNKKGPAKSRQQIKAMLLAKEKVKDEDIDAPPNSDAKDDSLRIVEQQKCMPEKEEYVTKKPQIAKKRTVKKKDGRRAQTVRVVRSAAKNRSGSDTPRRSREESGSADTSLFKERASANSSNANSPDNSDRVREREALRRRQAEAREERRAERTQVDSREAIANDQSGTGQQDSEGETAPLPLAREPEPEIRRPSVVVQRSTIEKSATSRVTTTTTMHQMQQQKDPMSRPSQRGPSRMSLPPSSPEPIVRPSQQRGASRSSMGLPPSGQDPNARPSQRGTSRMGLPPSSATAAKPESSSQSTQLALEPEPDLDRVRRQKEAAFMKRFLTALKLLPNTAPPRPITPPPKSEDSPSDSSKSRQRNYKHKMHNMRKHPK